MDINYFDLDELEVLHMMVAERYASRMRDAKEPGTDADRLCAYEQAHEYYALKNKLSAAVREHKDHPNNQKA